MGSEMCIRDSCEASGATLALVTVDLDEFKQVNDRYSHSLGDQVLIATADAIRENLRADELVARRGGDEFTIVCLPDQRDDLVAVITRIADAIGAARLDLCPDITATASIGHIVRRHGEDANSLLERADQVLHDTKTASRRSRIKLVQSVVA